MCSVKKGIRIKNIIRKTLKVKFLKNLLSFQSLKTTVIGLVIAPVMFTVVIVAAPLN